MLIPYKLIITTERFYNLQESCECCIAKPLTLIIVIFIASLPFLLSLTFTQIQLFFSVTPKTCSCFSIHEEGVTWPDARKSCQNHGGDLVSIETEHEWQVLKDQIENRTNRFNNSWYIGLRMKSRGIWTWVSGKPLTLNQWHGWQPRDGAPYAVMTKTFSPGTKRLFRNVKGSIFAGFICEKPVGK